MEPYDELTDWSRPSAAMRLGPDIETTNDATALQDNKFPVIFDVYRSKIIHCGFAFLEERKILIRRFTGIEKKISQTLLNLKYVSPRESNIILQSLLMIVEFHLTI